MNARSPRSGSPSESGRGDGMSVLDRYISREFLLTFFFVLLAFLCLYLMIDFFERIRMFLSNNATIAQILSYHLYTLPSVVTNMMPACVLLAALITFGLFSRNHEIVAMKANGISLYRIARPVLVFALVVCGLNFLLNEFVTPAANWRSEYIIYAEIQKNKEWGAFKENQIWFKSQNAIYNIKLFCGGPEPAEGRYDQLSRSSVPAFVANRCQGGNLERRPLGASGCTADDLCREGFSRISNASPHSPWISPRNRKTSGSSRKAPIRWVFGN